MRFFETFFLIGLAIATFQSFLPPKKRSFSNYLMIFMGILFMLHIFVEHYRWQMIPSYGLFLILFIFRTHSVLMVRNILLALLLSGSIFIPYAIPVLHLPNPSGIYTVGTSLHHWVDGERLEWFTDEDAEDVRELMVQVWYPAKTRSGGQLAPYIDQLDIRAKSLGVAGGFPSFLSGHLNLTKTHSIFNLPAHNQGAPFPLIILSHGLKGMRHLHTSMAENLASHGYVVAALDHSYDANITVFSEGRWADYRSNLNGHPDSAQVRHKQLDTRVKDILFVLNQFERIDSGELNSPLIGLMDLKRIGVMGHSFGGSASIQAAIIDTRIKTCLVLDGWLNPLPEKTLKTGLQQPFLYLGRPNWNDSDYPSNYTLLDSLIQHNQNDQFRITIKGTRHMDFSDVPLFSPFIGYILETGTINRQKVVSLVNDLTKEFFNQTLANIPSPLLNRNIRPSELIFHPRP